MTQARKHDGGYRRSWKKWLAIYLAAGVVIYGLIYLILKSGGSSGGGLYS